MTDQESAIKILKHNNITTRKDIKNYHLEDKKIIIITDTTTKLCTRIEISHNQANDAKAVEWFNNLFNELREQI